MNEPVKPRLSFALVGTGGGGFDDEGGEGIDTHLVVVILAHFNAAQTARRWKFFPGTKTSLFSNKGTEIDGAGGGELGGISIDKGGHLVEGAVLGL